jgi:putative membrane-bound dehydrogenase-like protein
MRPARPPISAFLAGIGLLIWLSSSQRTPAQESQPASDPTLQTIALDGREFTLPVGFTLERAAGPPLVDRPITVGLDDRGRLYVGESSGTNDPVEKQLAAKPHRILRLEDRDGDGVYDHRTVYADRLMFPEGTLWHDGSLYVTAPPQIWKFTDTDDDGVADQREIWFDAKTLTGCANDLHGPYLGRDGYIYWCKGAFAEQTYERPGMTPFVTRAAHIFRRRADGQGPIEPVMTGGMDNPVDVAFLPSGERIFTTTFLVHPGGGQRDGLIHNVYGGIWGKDHDPIHQPAHRWTSPDLMPVLVHLGPAAPSGLHCFESSTFGPEFQHNLFAACFNLHQVTRHRLSPKGSTFEAQTTDFLTSPDLDFHPTDVLEDADGSLLVVNTGGWYKLCCPTSQLHKPDILGAIYRIRRADAARPADPWGREHDLLLARLGTDLKVEELDRLWTDPRHAFRKRLIAAYAALARGKPADLEATLAQLHSFARHHPRADVRRDVVWILAQSDAPSAGSLIRGFLDDPAESVRQAALNAASLLRLAIARDSIVPLLKQPSLPNRRAAAEALGRIGDGSVVPALLAAAALIDNDRMLDHALTYALIEIADATRTAEGLSDPSPRVQCIALVALDQIEGSHLSPNVLLKLLPQADPELNRTIWWILGRHPEWGDAVSRLLADQLAQAGSAAEADQILIDRLARFLTTPSVQNLVTSTLADAGSSAAQRRLVLQALARTRMEQPPTEWVEPLARLITSPIADESLTRNAIQAVAGFKPLLAAEPIQNALNAIAHDQEAPGPLRLAALATLGARLGALDRPTFDFLANLLNPDTPLSDRLTATDLLSQAQLSPELRADLARLLAQATSIELPRLLAAFKDLKDSELARTLLRSLEQSPGRFALAPGEIRERFANLPPDLRAAADSLAQSLDQSQAERAEKITRLLSELGPGDIRRGQRVFQSTKAACSSCHAVGYLGGRTGPDLSRIGDTRSERDLLEAIVEPSASFVRSYEPWIVATTTGQVHNGILVKDSADEVILTTAADTQVRIPRAEVEELRPGTVSVMPSGLDQQLTKQDLADLIAFLKASR